MSRRIAVVGLGSIGRRHLRNLRDLCPDATIAVCRLSDESKSADIPTYANMICHSLDELIQFAPHAAIIATPASTHERIASALVASEIHVLIEKPLTTDARSAARLQATIKASNVVAMVGYNLRFLPGLQLIKKTIDQGQLGNILSVRAEVGQYLPDWRPDQDYRQSVSANAELGGGALLELSHELDYLLWLFGLPLQVIATGGNTGQLDLEVEDLVEMVMKYKAGPLVSVHMDFLDRAGFRTMRVIGAEASLVWDAITDTVTRHDPYSKSGRVLAVEPIAGSKDAYQRELSHFLDCVDSGNEPLTTVSQAACVIAVVDAARSSLLSGEFVEVIVHG